MAKLGIIADYLERCLKVSEIPDYPGAVNGLQLESGKGHVAKIIAAVDACLPVVREAVALNADLLIVHHGLFWQGAQKIEGSLYDKLKLAMDHELAIYSCHIPLDVHAKLGNNVLLGKAIGLKQPTAFFPWRGIDLGLRYRSSGKLASLAKKVERAVGSPVHVCAGGSETVKNIGIITGGAGTEVHAMAEAGIDTFITGEGPHWSYTSAEELGINVIYGGHYATETFGVKALAEHLARKFKLKSGFVDHPTGL